MPAIELKQQANRKTEEQHPSVKTLRNNLMLAEAKKEAPVPNSLYEGIVLLAKGSVTNIAAVERFRMLRAKLERHNLGEKQYHVLAVTSAGPEEGKSIICVNFARALAIDPFGKTLLIDADLRKPTVHQFFGLLPEHGLSDVLTETKSLEAVVRNISPGLDVMTCGNPILDPQQAMEQPLFAALLEELKNRYRYVLIDCPPVLVCSEPITISTIVDTILLVVRAWRTDRRLVEDSVEAIGKSKIMGIVMNDVIDASRQYLDYGYYGYYGYYHRVRKKKDKDGKTS